MKRAIITESIAPMMLTPDILAELSDEVLHGMEVEVSDETDGDWLKVKTHYHYKGYIEKKYMSFDEGNIERYRNSKKYVVTSSTLDVMSIPKVRGSIIKCLVKGAVIVKTGFSEDNWCGVVTADGREGYVRERLLTEQCTGYDLSSEHDLRKRFVDTAMSYLKTQYRWGGKTPQGIDCSGLTSMSYLLNGVIIYRDADIKDMADGYEMRELVFNKQTDDLMRLIKPGDLIFYPGHVVMYIGSGKYIHSSPVNEGVGINSLAATEPDYLEHLSVGHITKVGTIFNV